MVRHLYALRNNAKCRKDENRKVKQPLKQQSAAFRRVSTFLLICSMVYLSFIGYGMRALPEELRVIEQPANKTQVILLYTAQPEPTKLAQEANGTPGEEETAAESQLENQVEESSNISTFRFLKLFPVKQAKITAAKRRYVALGGDVFGIKLYTRGVLVAKTDLAATENGNENPAQAAGLRAGDVILEIDGKAVNRKKEVSDAIEQSGGTPLQMKVERAGEEHSLACTPVKSANGDKYIAGLWIRDSSAGIGTVTFYDKQSGTMAGLGHAICDVDTGEIMTVSGGELVSAKVMGCYKGVDGTPGELCGVFEQEKLATLEHNSDCGIYGFLAAEDKHEELVPVALKTEVKTGPAQAIVTVSGKEKKAYALEIVKVSPNANTNQKNMTIKITDPDLIEVTGGIVQGMSGSPIVQEGMLVGAITHVFVNTPLEGYAIFAETMLEQAQSLAQ